MGKKIHTIQSSDKVKFDKEVSLFIEFDSELIQGTYGIINEDDGVVYSQVVQFDTDNHNVEFFSSGKIERFGIWVESKRDGLWIQKSPDGKKSWEMVWVEGKPYDGKWTEWFSNGQKESEGNWKGGKEVGKHTVWYEDGKKKSEGNWKDEGGKEVEIITTWYENGQKEYEGTYKGDKQDGKWTYYNEDGTVKEVKEY